MECPKCESTDVVDKFNAGTVAGGVAGAFVAVAATGVGVLKGLVFGGGPIRTAVSTVIGAGVGVSKGAGMAKKGGQLYAKYIRGRYKCSNCGAEFEI